MRESMESLKGVRLRKPERGVSCEELFFNNFSEMRKGHLRSPSLTKVDFDVVSAGKQGFVKIGIS